MAEKKKITIEKADWIIILFSIAGIFLSFFLLPSNNEKKELVVISDNKKSVYTLDNADFYIRNSFGFLRVKIDNEKVRILDSSCSDKSCIYGGEIEKPGESLLCLPSKIMLIIKSRDDSEERQYDTTTH